MRPWVRWLPSATWAVLILLFSAQPETFFFPGSHGRHYRFLHYYLEIAVHLVEFCFFFVLVVWPLRSWGRPRVALLGVAFGAVLVLSLINESIQAFTPTRMFDVWDMIVDALGGAIGALLVVGRDSAEGSGRSLSASRYGVN